MSRDIRSFFTVIPKNKKASSVQQQQPVKKKTTIIIDSDEDDVVPATPEQKVKKRKAVSLNSSDSENEEKVTKAPTPKKVKKEEVKPKLKPINVADALGEAPVRQSKVEVKKPVKVVEKKIETKTKKKKGSSKQQENEALEKTLLELDDDFLVENMDILDKTIEEAINNDVTPKKTKAIAEVMTPKNGSARKRKMSEDGSEDTPEDRLEKKRHSAMLYQQYLHRPAPKNHGKKELPNGKPDCLNGLCFLRTGVLDSLDEKEFDDLIHRHGGRTVHSVSRKVNYVVLGDEPGPAKFAKAQQLGISMIQEDDLLELIKLKSGLDSVYSPETSDKRIKCESAKAKVEEPPVKVAKTSSEESPKKETRKIVSETKPTITDNSPIKTKPKNKTANAFKDEKPKPEDDIPVVTVKTKTPPVANKPKPKMEAKISNKNNNKKDESTELVAACVPLTEKYKPKNIQSIIGQQGDKSNMSKLLNWLKNWNKNHLGRNKPKLPKPSPWNTNHDGSSFKCALLSGPPGVGKTTTATLVAKELGFDVVEFNASDTRSKKSLHEEVMQLLSTNSLAGFAISDSVTVSSKRVLLMDEVDGMAGNEDRGGMQELINLIKQTKVPIICMCNDRNHQKIRSLANHCYDLRFIKPRLEQIRGAMMSICFKEGIKISAEALGEIINGCGMDIRQTLNHLSMWTAGENTLSKETAAKEANAAKKDVVLGPFDVIRQVFSKEAHQSMSIADRERLFFYDYSLGPLFVQENYLSVRPHVPEKQAIHSAALAAEAISMSDLVDAKMRSTNNWSLLQTEAYFASVLPGHYMEGYLGNQINFPSWLGKNSKRAKFQRLLGELQTHMRTRISGGKIAVNLDYLKPLRHKIISPLIKRRNEGIEEAISVMNTYQLLREDLDSIIELSLWKGKQNPMNLIDSKVKAAFTRSYNKEAPLLPFAVANVQKKKTGSGENEGFEEEGEEEGGNDGEEEEDDITKDAMIKAKKKPTKVAAKKDEKPAKKDTKKRILKK